MSRRINVRLQENTIDIIEQVARQKGMSKQKAIDYIVSEYEGRTKAKMEYLAEELSKKVIGDLQKELVRIRLGTNTIDRNAQIMIELFNTLMIENGYNHLASTQDAKVGSLKEAEEVVQKRIEGFRVARIEKEKSAGVR